MGTRITKTIVEQVNRYIKKYPKMSKREIGKLVGIGTTSVWNICNGMYDHLLVEEVKVPEVPVAEECAVSEEVSAPAEKVIKSDIPYETYRRLVSCELAIKEIFNRASLSKSDECSLFVDYRFVSSVLERHFPDEFKETLRDLHETYGEDAL